MKNKASFKQTVSYGIVWLIMKWKPTLSNLVEDAATELLKVKNG